MAGDIKTSSQFLQLVLAEMARQTPDTSIRWKGGKRPLDFLEFCEALDGHPLFPRQEEAFRQAGVVTPEQFLGQDRTRTELDFMWGKGCLAAETLLTDAQTKETKTVKEWAEIGCHLTLLSAYDRYRTVAAVTSPVYLKGQAQIFKVTLVDGRTLRCTGEHKCHDGEEWRRVKDLRPMDCIVALTPTRAGHPPKQDLKQILKIEAQGVEDFYDLTVPVTHCYFDHSGFLSHNSGKDYVLAKVYTYYPYMFSHLRDDPITVIGKIAGKTLANKTRIDCVNVAPTEDLGRQVFFDYIKVFLSSALFDNIRMYPTPNKFAPGTDEIIFPEYKLHLYSKPSTARGLDGYNLLLYAMDEADAFLDNANRSNADEIHKVFRTSSSTRMGRCALGLVFSYPRTETGFMMRLRDRAKMNPHLFFWDEAPTHEMRPDFSLDDPQVKEEFVNDYADASAKYLCKPQATHSPFFENADIMATLMRPISAGCADWRVEEEEVEAEEDGVRHKMMRLYIDKVRKELGRRYFLAIDAGRKQDSFGISIWSIGEGGKGYSWLCPQCWKEAEEMLDAGDYEVFGRDWIDSEDGGDLPVCGFCSESPVKRGIGWMTPRWRKLKEAGFKRVPIEGAEYALPFMREELLIEVRPRRKTQVGDWSAEVDFVFAQGALTKLANALDVKAIGADVHQMATIIQHLRHNAGKKVKEVSFSNPEQVKRAKLCKVALNRALLSFLPNQRRDTEWRRLQWLGGSVDHEKGGSKDLYDCESMAITLACEEAGCVFKFAIS